MTWFLEQMLDICLFLACNTYFQEPASFAGAVTSWACAGLRVETKGGRTERLAIVLSLLAEKKCANQPNHLHFSVVSRPDLHRRLWCYLENFVRVFVPSHSTIPCNNAKLRSRPHLRHHGRRSVQNFARLLGYHHPCFCSNKRLPCGDYFECKTDASSLGVY